EYEHWCVLLRPAQATLGALVLVCTDDAGALSRISAGAFAELAVATSAIERSLAALRAYDPHHYLMPMLVDPDVHLHGAPRYSSPQDYGDTTFPDPGWPAVPDLSSHVSPDPGMRDSLVADLRRCWIGG